MASRHDPDYKVETQDGAFLNHRGSTVITIDLITFNVSKTSILQADSEVWRREERGREEKQTVS